MSISGGSAPKLLLRQAQRRVAGPFRLQDAVRLDRGPIATSKASPPSHAPATHAARLIWFCWLQVPQLHLRAGCGGFCLPRQALEARPRAVARQHSNSIAFLHRRAWVLRVGAIPPILRWLFGSRLRP